MNGQLLTSRHFVVYQTPSGKLGYRSLGIELPTKGIISSSDMLMQSMVALGEVTQCWCVQAGDGGRAITKVKHIMKSEALK